MFRGSNISTKIVGQTITSSNNNVESLAKIQNQSMHVGICQLNGHFDFNRTPLPPLGTRFIAHEKTDQRASCDPHGVDGYYLGPTLDQYRCYQVHATKTKGTRIVDTAEFFPSKLSMPNTSLKYLASIAALELSNALQNPPPAAPFSHIGTAQLQAMRQLSDTFMRHFRLAQPNMHPH
jgi:hypothetical protein